MSAFLCAPEDLAALARAYVAHITPAADAETIYADLLATNLASLGARYPDAATIGDWYTDGEPLFIWSAIPEPTDAPTATALEELARSYEYQSCEHDGWKDSTAKLRVTKLRAALVPFVESETAAKTETDRQRRAALNALPSLNPKQTAAMLRRLFKRMFPATSFSVVTERGSMVSSVRVTWTDGPTLPRVKEIAQSFEAGHFDGMTDSYDYDADALLEIDGTKYRPGTRYVFTERAISPALATKCIQRVATYYGGVSTIPVAVAGYQGFNLEPATLNYEPVRPDLDRCHDSWMACINRAANDATAFCREG